MRRIFVFFIFIQASLIIAQESGENFYFKTSIGKTSSLEIIKDGDGGKLSGDFWIKKRAKIKVLREEGDRIVFKYLKYTNNKSLNALYNGVDGDKEFSMQKEVFKGLTNPFYRYFRGFSLGSYTVPIRLRSSNDVFEFDSNLSLGINLIARGSPNRFSENFFFDISAGISITQVNLNEDNSGLGEGEFADINTQNPSAITFSLGLLVNLAKNVNVGGHIGWDSLSTADNRAGWIYNKKPWFGIGLGISLVDPASNNSKSAENTGG